MANKTEGRCRVCGQTYAGSGITTHLKSHLNRISLAKTTAATTKMLYLKISDGNAYFLHVLVPGNFTLQELDAFLRHIWLECCGHLSEFMWDWDNTVKMSKKIAAVLSPKASIRYAYDFGSTTELNITMMDTYNLPVTNKNEVIILSRNEEYHFTCTICGNEADSICNYCMYEIENPFYCEDCGCDESKHSCGEEGLLPTCNSPRMGVCAYVGDEDDDEFSIVDIGQDKVL